MARYNTSLATNTISGSTNISSPYSGAFTALSGTAPYTVTLPSPVLYPGSNQTFYNTTTGTITLSTPSGSFTGTGGTNSSTVSVYAGNVVSVTSDGTNYVVISEDGSALIATTGNFSGNVDISGTLTVTPTGGVSISPSTTGVINNVAIGNTTRAAGNFTSLAANGQVSFTANVTSTTTGTGTLVVTGGLGVSGTINAANVNANLTGAIQTAAQPNITSVGTLSSLSVSGGISSSTGDITTGNKFIPYSKSIAIPATVSAGWYRFAQTTAAAGANGSRGSFKASIISTGGYMSPGQTVIYGFKDWSGTALINSVEKTGSQYFTQWRIATTSDTAYLEGYTSGWSMAAANSMVIMVESYGFNPSVWSATTDSTLTAGLASSTITIYNPTLTIDSNSGAIGINQNPTALLTVKASDGATGGIRLEHSAGNGPVANIYQSASDGYLDLYTGENPTTLRVHLSSYGDSYFKPNNNGRLGINTSDFSYSSSDNSPVVGGNTSNKLFVSGSIQLLNNDDAIVIGRGTASFFKDEEIGFGWGGGWYMTDASYLRVRNNKTLYTAGKIMVGTGANYAVSDTAAIITSGPVSHRDGRYIVSWYTTSTSSSYSYLHIRTSLWGGGSPRGNDMYIMGGFHLMGYYYTNPGAADQWITFHNWSGTTNNGYNKTSAGNWNADTAAYVASDGYVAIRVPSGQYIAWTIDLWQSPIYPVRDIYVTGTTYSNSTTV